MGLAACSEEIDDETCDAAAELDLSGYAAWEGTWTDAEQTVTLSIDAEGRPTSLETSFEDCSFSSWTFGCAEDAFPLVDGGRNVRGGEIGTGSPDPVAVRRLIGSDLQLGSLRLDFKVAALPDADFVGTPVSIVVGLADPADPTTQQLTLSVEENGAECGSATLDLPTP